MLVMNATTARKNLFKLIDEVILTHEHICITGKNGNVIMISEEDWKSIQERLYLSSVLNIKRKILKGLNTPLSECVEDNE
ncbi:type II toxin-antitoxin system Phd/YefM family antitoxin [Azotosporobacter soli]|uniref:type II toxin-antitoxin system Phd/YefM family antitoxin n=1 Tax=Azotosporobacter soli TaxID=3055040 RepID=UPI0031FECD76